MSLNKAALKDFLLGTVEPLFHPIYGNQYRASVYLTDGTYLPCVLFQSRKLRLHCALKRFSELARRPDQYEMAVSSFVSKGSSISEWSIDSIEASSFAWPIALLKHIKGETAMSWTSFVVEMQDGSHYSYGTTYSIEFFELPKNYTYKDINNIQSGMVYSLEHGLTAYSIEKLKAAKVYRELPYFDCYLDNLD